MSDTIGKPDDYIPGRTTNRPSDYSGHTGGYIEERVAKTEYELRDIDTLLNSNIPCIACGGLQAATPSYRVIPICSECLANVGTITKAKKNLKFLG